MLLNLLACHGSPIDSPTAARVPAAAPIHGTGPPPDRVLTVDCRGQGDYRSILDALDDATSGATLWVAPCTYYGSISFHGKSVAIRSVGGPDVTTILANPGEPVVVVKHGEAPGTLLEGFTLSGGGGPLIPAIDDEFSTLTLRNDVITRNAGNVTVYNRAGYLVLDHVRLEANTPADGMVIQGRRGEVVLEDSEVHCDGSAFGYVSEHAAAFVDRSTFDCPDATAVYIYHSDGRVQRSTLDGLLHVENERTSAEPSTVEDSILRGGALVTDSVLTVRNVVSTDTLAASAAELVVVASIVTGAACGISSEGSTVTTRHSDFWHNTTDTCGPDNPTLSNSTFSADPTFTDAAHGDFHLAAGSPCIDAGPSDPGYADPDGTPNDVGAFGGPLVLPETE
jgi:hypothetical protein